VTRTALEADVTIAAGRGAGAFTVEASVSLEAGVLVLFGPSGAGKTLTLRSLAGLLRPVRGFVRAGGEALFDADKGIDVPAHLRRVGYVPQHQALFPHLDVLGNVVFGLSRGERKRPGPEVLGLLEELGIAHLAAARVGSLSGGERQRVALGRALAARPRLLLLDEPFSALDRVARDDLGRKLREALDRRGLSAVLVTHDPDEAAALGDRVVRFERGRSVEAMAAEEMFGPNPRR